MEDKQPVIPSSTWYWRHLKQKDMENVEWNFLDFSEREYLFLQANRRLLTLDAIQVLIVFYIFEALFKQTSNSYTILNSFYPKVFCSMLVSSSRFCLLIIFLDIWTETYLARFEKVLSILIETKVIPNKYLYLTICIRHAIISGKSVD